MALYVKKELKFKITDTDITEIVDFISDRGYLLVRFALLLPGISPSEILLCK